MDRSELEEKHEQLFENLVGDLIEKRCPKCRAQLFGNAVGDEWCSNPECDFGLEDHFQQKHPNRGE